MNNTTVSFPLPTRTLASPLLNPGKISADLHPLLIARIAVNALTCPLIIVLNILVMVAVKTKRQLRTKSNIALACLATSDLVVGLILQPLHIARDIFLLKGQENTLSSISEATKTITVNSLVASFNHLVLVSAERYVAVKQPFAYETQVTEVRIIMASGLAWAAAIIVSTQNLLRTKEFIHIIITVSETLLLILPVYFNVSVYKEVRRNEKQIAANQVSLEAKEKLLKNKKAFYTTIIILFVIFLCYIPTNICILILFSFKTRIPANLGHIAVHIFMLLPVLNSLFNPLIYAVRIRYFRVTFIQLLSRKTISQAEELERKIFGPRQIGVIANVEQGQNIRASREDEQQGNETLNNGHETTVRTQLQEEYEETAL